MFASAFSNSPLSRKCFASSWYARAIPTKSSATLRRWDGAGTAILAFASARSVKEMSLSTRAARSTDADGPEGPKLLPPLSDPNPTVRPLVKRYDAGPGQTCDHSEGWNQDTHKAAHDVTHERISGADHGYCQARSQQ